MQAVEITSRSNEKIKDFIRLAESSKLRRENGIFAVEGLRLCYDAFLSGYEINELFYTDTAMRKYGEKLSQLFDNSKAVFNITDDIAKKMSDTVNPQGIFCVVKIKETQSCNILKGKKYIALENIQTPDNLGAVSRTAEALGIDALIINGGCDIYNSKALRASMGSLLRLPVIIADDLTALIDDAEGLGLNTYAAVPDINAQSITDVDFSIGAVVVIGNEGNGVSDEIQNKVYKKITIPMSGKSESLNAAAAAVITMWEMTK